MKAAGSIPGPAGQISGEALSGSKVASGVRRTKPATEHAHDGALLHHSQVCQQSQLQPSGHSEAAHRRYQRLRQLQTGWTLEDAKYISVQSASEHTHTHMHSEKTEGKHKAGT